jgi:cell division protein DivIC
MLSTAANSNWQNLWLRVQSLGFFVFAGIVAAGVALLLFVPALARKHSMQLEIRRLDAEIVRQESLEKQQRQEIESLKTDPSYVERVARNKLNLARPNEVIFRFEQPPTAQAAPQPRH